MAHAGILYVDGDKATNGTGVQWSTAFNNLQSAIDEAGQGEEVDEIWVKGKAATGITYKPGAARADTFALKSRVKIYGGFAGTETPAQFALRDPVANLTILSGDIGTANDPSDNCYHVVTATGALEFPNTVLDGFTIKRGNTIPDGRNDPPANYSGAGILISGDGQTCEPIIARCVFVENEADANGGGGIVGRSDCVGSQCDDQRAEPDLRGERRHSHWRTRGVAHDPATRSVSTRSVSGSRAPQRAVNALPPPLPPLRFGISPAVKQPAHSDRTAGESDETTACAARVRLLNSFPQPLRPPPRPLHLCGEHCLQ